MSPAPRTSALLARLAAELTRRQDLLAAGDLAGITEQRGAAPPGGRLPHISSYWTGGKGFTITLGETNDGAVIDVIISILAEGASAGESIW